jgi:hypothetical protein
MKEASAMLVSPQLSFQQQMRHTPDGKSGSLDD